MTKGVPPASFAVQEFPVLIEAMESRLLLSGNPNLWPLPLPDANVASDPPMQPSVVTAGGQRLLLTYFNNTIDTSTSNGVITAATTSGPLGSPITVTYNPQTDQLVSNKPGWWIINFPLDQIQGLPNILNNTCGMTDQQIQNTVAADLFGPGTTAATIQNWYILTPVDADHPLAPEPNVPTEPAPITPTNLTNSYVLVVDQNYSGSPSQDPWAASRIAAGQNVIVAPTVYSTISAAMNAIYSDPYYNSTTNSVTKQTVVLVAPGTYREFVYDNCANGTATCPLIFEGIPDANGNMPMISAATVFANNSWTVQTTLGDVNVSGENLYRANIPFTTDDNGNDRRSASGWSPPTIRPSSRNPTRTSSTRARWPTTTAARSSWTCTA